MKKTSNKPPYHWRAGHGYMPPGAVPVAAPFPPTGLCYGPLPHPVGPSPCIPLHRHVYACTPSPYTVEVKPCSKAKPKQKSKPEPAPTVTDADSSDSESCSDTTGSSSGSSESSEVTLVEEPTTKKKASSKITSKKISSPSAPGPGGLRKGIKYLRTGNSCSFHIIDGSKVNLKDLTNGNETPAEFKFRIYSAQDNATFTELITALGGGDGSSVTQIWEWGNGYWKKGSTIVKGSEKAELRLSDLGWSKAGDRMKPPVWLYVKRK